jgi:ATP-dependent Lon protease
MLISGGEVTSAKLFVNNASNKPGLVEHWDTICFDEFAGKDKKVDKGLVDIMKNYMANRSFSRGVVQLTAEASMVFMGNTKKSVAYMLKHSHFFEPLPDKYIDSAFLDRIHAYNPGWEVSPVRHELFTNGYGFIVDYLAEVLKHLRTEDFTGAYKEHFEITSEVSTRDQTGFEKTFSGLMKILFPGGKCTPKEMEELLAFSMESRRRVREHILRIDDTFSRNEFIYRSLAGGTPVTVLTPEEIQYPTFSGPRIQPSNLDSGAEDIDHTESTTAEDGLAVAFNVPDEPAPGHLVIPENTKGWSYRNLFAKHLKGARSIVIGDPYVRKFFQVRNLMELLQVVHNLVPVGDEVAVHLKTQSDSETCVQQEENLNQMVKSFTGSCVTFSWEYDRNPNFHARSITTDTGWKITIDRGLDIFQKYESGAFSLEQAIQEARLTRGADISYIKL